MTLLLIRHGETALNAGRVVQPPDTPLSEVGIAQAARLAERVAKRGLQRIVASDLKRAHMTADAIQAATGVAIEFEPSLQERNFGDWRGTPYTELEARKIDLFADDYEPPGGESWAAFHRRVDSAWQTLRALAMTTNGDLAIVTHGLVCSSLVQRHLGSDVAKEGFLRFDNTSLTEIESAEPWRVLLLNCTAHLDGPSDRDSAPA